MLCRLNEVKASFTGCLLQFMWYFIQRKCKRLGQHLSVNLEKACVTVFNMYHVTKNRFGWNQRWIFYITCIILSQFCYFGSLHGGKVEWTQKSIHVHWCNWPFTLYITSYNIVSWGFIEACATCSPINTHDIQEHNVLFAAFCKFGLCTIYSVLIGHIPLTQKTLNT